MAAIIETPKNTSNGLSDERDRKKYTIIVNIVVKIIWIFFLIMLTTIRFIIIEYLNKNYEENEDEDEPNNKENRGIKTTNIATKTFFRIVYIFTDVPYNPTS